MSARQDGDILFDALIGFDIEVLAGVVTMTGGFATALQLSLFGGSYDDDALPGNPLTWWGNRGETRTERTYRSRTQYLLRRLPMTSGNLRLIEEAARQDTQWLLDLSIADAVAISASIPDAKSLQLVATVTANGVAESFTFVENWNWLRDNQNRIPSGRALRSTIPRGTLPTDFLGLALWLDAGDPSTLTKTGDDVDAWADKSGAGLTGGFAVYDVAAKPTHGVSQINGVDAVAFSNAADEALVGTGGDALPGADGYSMFAVVADTAAADGQIIGKGSDPGTTEYAFTPDELTSEHPLAVGPGDQLHSLVIPDNEVEAVVLESATPVTADIADEFTFSIWFKPTNLPTTTRAICSISPDSGANGKISLRYNGSIANEYQVEIQGSSGGATIHRFTGEAMVIGAWINLGFTYNAGTLTLYKNGAVAPATIVAGGASTLTNDSRWISLAHDDSGNIRTDGQTSYSWGVWSSELSGAEMAAIYNSGNAVNVSLASDFGDYVSSAALEHWWRFGFGNEIDDIGVDYGNGSNPRTLTVTEGTLDAGDIVAEYPEAAGAKYFSTVDVGVVDLDPKIITAIVDGATALATARGFEGRTEIEFQPDFQAFKPNPSTPDSPAPPHAVGGQYNGVATTITRRFEGSIGEVLVYDRPVSDAERAEIENYLAAKWGVAL